MGWLHDIRLRLHHAAVQQALRQQRFTRVSTPYAQLKRVGLLFDATEVTRREQVLDWAERLRREDRTVYLLGYFPDQLAQPEQVFPNFGKKNLNWRLEPQGEAVEKMRDQSLDLLVNLDQSGHLPLHYLAALSKAHFRVGPVTTYTDYYELMIDATDPSLPPFIEQVAHYLQKMNTPRHVSKS